MIKTSAGAACLLIAVTACGSSSAPARPGPEVGVARAPADAAPAPTAPLDAGVEVDAVAEAELDYQGEDFAADLDGDGRVEPIHFDCAAQIVRVGKARIAAPLDTVELMGCYAAVVALRPQQAARQLLVSAQDHDEVGPPHHALFAYDGQGLEVIWDDRAELSIRVDGGWRASTTDCFEASAESVTTIQEMTWDGVEVATVETVDRTPVEPGDCAEP